MSPNLSTKHFSGNRLLYEQVIYNFLRLVGIGRPGLKSSSQLPTTKEEFEMQVSREMFCSTQIWRHVDFLETNIWDWDLNLGCKELGI